MAQAGLITPSRVRSVGSQPALLLVFVAVCSISQAVATLPARSIAVRGVRVRLAADVARVRVRSDAMIQVADFDGSRKTPLDAATWHVVKPTGRHGIRCGEHLFPSDGVAMFASSSGSMTIAFDRGAGWSPGHTYSGSIHFHRSDGGRLSVTNEIDVERYVASVVAHEVWPTFDREVYRAQAIVARTYVLYTMMQRQTAGFDVRADQSSQVYRGIRADGTGRRAKEATRYTRGIVATWDDGNGARLFSAFYSAVCGGLTQSAAPFGPEHDIEPLAGGVHCDYCKDAPGDTYRWGPVRIDKNAVLSRLRMRIKEAGDLGTIINITVTDRTPQGRPIKLRITGSTGRSLDVSAESFRLAVGAERMRSTDCTIRVTQRYLVVENGRGFGHGVGLCQWGAQGLARQGKTAAEILRFYYPGSRLARVY